MINTRLTAVIGHHNCINLKNVDDDIVATFSSPAFFYVVTGFKTVEAYNEYQAEQPTKFLLWERKH